MCVCVCVDINPQILPDYLTKEMLIYIYKEHPRDTGSTGFLRLQHTVLLNHITKVFHSMLWIDV